MRLTLWPVLVPEDEPELTNSRGQMRMRRRPAAAATR
jgi:hypothetical protein